MDSDALREFRLFWQKLVDLGDAVSIDDAPSEVVLVEYDQFLQDRYVITPKEMVPPDGLEPPLRDS